MNTRVIALVVLLALGTLAVPAAVPALEVAPNAAAARCLMGPGCIIPVNCVSGCDCDPFKQYFRECDPES